MEDNIFLAIPLEVRMNCSKEQMSAFMDFCALVNEPKNYLLRSRQYRVFVEAGNKYSDCTYGEAVDAITAILWRPEYDNYPRW